MSLIQKFCFSCAHGSCVTESSCLFCNDVYTREVINIPTIKKYNAVFLRPEHAIHEKGLSALAGPERQMHVLHTTKTRRTFGGDGGTESNGSLCYFACFPNAQSLRILLALLSFSPAFLSFQTEA